MANQDVNNIVGSVLDAQKQAVDTMVENTKKITNGNAMVNDTLAKGSEWYKNWLDTQKNTFTQATNKTSDMSGNMQQNMGQMNDHYNNWFNTQMNQAKQMWDMNTNFFQNAANNNGNTANMNPMNMFQNMTSNWNNWMTGMNNTSQWMSAMQNWNKMFNADGLKDAAQNWNGMFNQYTELLNSNWNKMQEGMQNGTATDAYRNMVTATEGFSRFYQMWAPMWKSIQDKTFNMDMYKQMMNPVAYKEMMDKFFGFMPEGSRQYMQQMTDMMQEGMKNMGGMGSQQYQQMRGMMGNMTQGFNASEMFGNMLNGYNSFYGQMAEAAAPFTKMMTPNQHTKTMTEWQDIANRMAIYNIRNAELQYMMYTQGTKSMDALAENIMNKMQSGEEVNSIMALFQEWMNLSDKTFVKLFESDEYSQLMAEVSAMQLKLKKDVEVQMEKFMTGIPVATRSEMDELYKTIYDLKKRVRDMERTADTDTMATAGTTAAPEATATTEDKTARRTNGGARK
jgi:polyhydroxyalkanoate synthesis regulator phasin